MAIIINRVAREMQDGTKLTKYSNTVGPTTETFQFLQQQESIVIENKGSAAIHYTVGTKSGTINPSEKVTIKENFQSFTLRSQEKTQHFEVLADEIGDTRGQFAGADNLARSQIDSLTAQLSQTVKKDEGGVITPAMLSQATKEQMTGGSVAVVGVNSVLKENIVDKAVTPEKTNFLLQGKNLFNKRKVTDGFYIDANGSGGIFASSNQSLTDYFPIKPNTTYSYTQYGYTINIAYYDSNLVKIGGVNGQASPLTTPANTAYVRFSYRTSLTDTMQFEEGGQSTTYEPFIYKIDRTQIEKFPFSVEDIPYRALSKEKMDFLNPSSNLFDKNDITNGYYVSGSNGQLLASSNYITSGFINVKENTYYSFTNSTNFRVVYYNAAKVFISSADKPTSPILTPANTKYIRFHINKNDISVNDMKFEEGQVQTPYEEFGLHYLDDNIIVRGSGSGGGGGESSGSSHLAGKTVVCFGDSITGSYSAPNDYPSYIAERLGATVHNVGFSGAKMSTDNTKVSYDAFSMAQIVDAIVSGDFSVQDAAQGTSQHYPAKLTTLKSINFNQVDIVTIFYGTNDFNSTIPNLDNESDKFDKTTVLGAARYAIRALLQAFPHLKIALLSTSWRTVGSGYADDTQNSKGYYMIDLVNGLKSVSEFHHIPFINMYNGLGLNQYNYTTYLLDGLHPNPTGRKLIADRISSQLLANL